MEHNYNKLQDRVKLLEVCTQVFFVGQGKNVQCTNVTIHSMNNYNNLPNNLYDMALFLLQVDVQSSKKNNEKLHAEIEELLRVKKTLEDQREENRALQASMSGEGGDDNKVSYCPFGNLKHLRFI